MKSVWKWVLGIALVLILCAAAAAGVFFALNHRYAVRAAPILQADQAERYAWRMPMHRGFDSPNIPYRQREFGPRMYPHMGIWGGPGLMPFGGAFMLLGGLLRLFVPLVIFGLVGLVAYQLGKQAGARTAASSAMTPPPAAPEAPEKGGEESPQ